MLYCQFGKYDKTTFRQVLHAQKLCQVCFYIHTIYYDKNKFPDHLQNTRKVSLKFTSQSYPIISHQMCLIPVPRGFLVMTSEFVSVKSPELHLVLLKLGVCLNQESIGFVQSQGMNHKFQDFSTLNGFVGINLLLWHFLKETRILHLFEFLLHLKMIL